MSESDPSAIVGIIMGSQSDWETMSHAHEILHKLGVSHETRIVSAHRTPERLFEYAKSAKGRGLKVIIAGAGGAAHLPGMTASMTPLPVLGVPVESKALSGMDSLLSIAQMPGGVPVGTLAIGKAGAINAALLAASILSLNDPDLAFRLDQFRKDQTNNVAEIPQ
ncbi:MAG: 5-(carboxyamino)imidazole ribonucleotide mutase [Pseudobdellovibrionaceae bacterium]|jgi:5-(carboxyamino)imidazole ribonucleotide mutase|nr:5-(carboxyamino)imidazole ribonucleotide mutase [Pseudobdellovibrionaceae bacterium]